MFFTARAKLRPPPIEAIGLGPRDRLGADRSAWPEALRRATEPFRFASVGPLVDGELELVPPAVRWVGAMVRSSGPGEAVIAGGGAGSVGERGARPVSRRHLLEIVGAAPRGREPGEPLVGRPPTYHFWMRLRGGRGAVRPLLTSLPAWLSGRPTVGGDPPVPPAEMAGSIALRIGRGDDLERYLGHVGYGVFPRARGRHYAERACRLVLPIARAHGLSSVWLTVNPDNRASRRTCERLGGRYVETVTLPPGHPLFERGEREKCRYRVDL